MITFDGHAKVCDYGLAMRIGIKRTFREVIGAERNVSIYLSLRTSLELCIHSSFDFLPRKANNILKSIISFKSHNKGKKCTIFYYHCNCKDYVVKTTSEAIAKASDVVFEVSSNTADECCCYIEPRATQVRGYAREKLKRCFI